MTKLTANKKDQQHPVAVTQTVETMRVINIPLHRIRAILINMSRNS